MWSLQQFLYNVVFCTKKLKVKFFKFFAYNKYKRYIFFYKLLKKSSSGEIILFIYIFSYLFKQRFFQNIFIHLFFQEVISIYFYVCILSGVKSNWHLKKQRLAFLYAKKIPTIFFKRIIIY